MASLHLPTSAKRKFTSAEVAEIARGASVRVRPHQAQRLIKAVALFEERLEQYQQAKSVSAAARQAMGNKTEAAWIDIDIGRPLYPMYCKVASVAEVNRDERRAKANRIQEIEHYREAIKDEAHPLYAERLSRLNIARKELKDIPRCARNVRAAVRKHLAELKGLHKRHGYKQKLVTESRASAAMWSALDALLVLPIESMADAAAVLRLTSAVIKSQVIYPQGVLALLDRAQSYLSKGDDRD
jgi:hypothetical protein